MEGNSTNDIKTLVQRPVGFHNINPRCLVLLGDNLKKGKYDQHYLSEKQVPSALPRNKGNRP